MSDYSILVNKYSLAKDSGERKEKFTMPISNHSGVFFFVFKVDKCTNCHNSNGYHYNKKSFHLQSSFTGVIAIANIKTINAIAEVIKNNSRLIVFSLSGDAMNRFDLGYEKELSLKWPYHCLPVPDGSLYYSAGPGAISGGDLIISLL